MTAASREGTTLGGKYVLSRLLGVGGMGEVYEATNVTIDRRVAIKFLRPEVATDPTTVERFRNEARAAGVVDNEHIAAALDSGIAEDGAPFIVMELLKGENLASLLVREGRLPVPQATDIIIQACRGLSAAHEKGIVHRDLKPENIFICKRAYGADLVKVLDFGIAKLRAGGSLTRPGTAMGTPLYMPPEQFANLASVGSPGDVYGLGAILYEALTGKKAHPDGSYYEIMHHVTNIDPQSIETLRPGFPPGLSDVVSRAMARKAGDRFQTVEALMEALKPFTAPGAPPDRTKVMPTTDRHAPTRPGAPSQPDLSGAGAGGLSEGPKKVRSNPSLPIGKAIGIGAALLVALAFGVWTLLASRSCVYTVPPVDAGVEDVAHVTDFCADDALPAGSPDTASPIPPAPSGGLSGRAGGLGRTTAAKGGRPGGRPSGRPQAAERSSLTQSTKDVPSPQPQVSGSPPNREPNVAPRPRSGLHLTPDQMLPENPAKPRMPRIEEVYPGNE